MLNNDSDIHNDTLQSSITSRSARRSYGDTDMMSSTPNSFSGVGESQLLRTYDSSHSPDLNDTVSTLNDTVNTLNDTTNRMQLNDTASTFDLTADDGLGHTGGSLGLTLSPGSLDIDNLDYTATSTTNASLLKDVATLNDTMTLSSVAANDAAMQQSTHDNQRHNHSTETDGYQYDGSDSFNSQNNSHNTPASKHSLATIDFPHLNKTISPHSFGAELQDGTRGARSARDHGRENFDDPSRTLHIDTQHDCQETPYPQETRRFSSELEGELVKDVEGSDTDKGVDMDATDDEDRDNLIKTLHSALHDESTATIPSPVQHVPDGMPGPFSADTTHDGVGASMQSDFSTASVKKVTFANVDDVFPPRHNSSDAHKHVVTHGRTQTPRRSRASELAEPTGLAELRDVDLDEPTEVDYLNFQDLSLEEVMTFDLTDEAAIRQLFEHCIAAEQDVTVQHRRADGSSRKALEEHRMRSMLESLLTQMGI